MMIMYMYMYTMDIIKAFVDNGVSNDINIMWEGDVPFFRAAEVGKVLEMANIRVTLDGKSFDPDEKVVRIVYTPGGSQEVTFLTEQGVYELLMISRKPIAKVFKKWIKEVLVSIRTTGRYELLQERIDQAVEERVSAVMETTRFEWLAQSDALPGKTPP